MKEFVYLVISERDGNQSVWSAHRDEAKAVKALKALMMLVLEGSADKLHVARYEISDSIEEAL